MFCRFPRFTLYVTLRTFSLRRRDFRQSSFISANIWCLRLAISICCVIALCVVLASVTISVENVLCISFSFIVTVSNVAITSLNESRVLIIYFTRGTLAMRVKFIQTSVPAVHQQGGVVQDGIVASAGQFFQSCTCSGPVQSRDLRAFASMGRPSCTEIDCRNCVAVSVLPCHLIWHWLLSQWLGPVAEKTLPTRMASFLSIGVTVDCICRPAAVHTGQSLPAARPYSVGGWLWSFWWSIPLVCWSRVDSPFSSKLQFPNMRWRLQQNFETKCGPLSVNRYISKLYEIAELLTSTVSVLVGVTVLTSMACVSFVCQSIKKITF